MSYNEFYDRNMATPVPNKYLWGGQEAFITESYESDYFGLMTYWIHYNSDYTLKVRCKKSKMQKSINKYINRKLSRYFAYIDRHHMWIQHYVYTNRIDILEMVVDMNIESFEHAMIVISHDNIDTFVPNIALLSG